MMYLQQTTNQITRARLDDAINRAQEYLLAQQELDGYWWAELEANVTLTAEFIMLHRILGTDREAHIQQAARYILREQRAHGGWELYYGDGGEISTSVEAYFALRLAGYDANDERLSKAREFILARGGVSKTRVFTKLHLALFGAFPWEGIPTLPPWFMFLPKWFTFNVYSMASWARSSTVPLLVVIEKRPVYQRGVTCDELYVEGSQAKADYKLKNNDQTWIGSCFLLADKALKLANKLGLVPLRQKGIAAAERWVIERQDHPGDWAGIIPAMLNSLLMFHALGYSNDHPYVKRGLEAIDRFGISEGSAADGEAMYYRTQPCVSPTWDTALAVTALLDSGLSPAHPKLKLAGEWLLSKQIFKYGDWAVYNRTGKPAGWAFEFHNDYYPDVDDTAAVVLALLPLKLDNEAYKQAALKAAMEWVMTMQCKAGGWAAFDIDNTNALWNQMPYGDLKAMIDPPTADVSSRVLEALGQIQNAWGEKLATEAQLQHAMQFLLALQERDGAYWGRWGVNYIYGTYLVLVGWNAIGFDMARPEAKRAADWLRSVQNADGGWGETCESYKRPELRGKGPSTASQTAWALLGLMAAGDYESGSVTRGIEYLLKSLNDEGTWPEAQFTGTGFPGHFYINYHQYRNQFPLTALGRYNSHLKKQIDKK
jgi:squalene-hopene/tetraprenyl-beta-curcumene cyclase